MSCYKNDEEFTSTHFPTNEESIDKSVDKKMESLRISPESHSSVSPTADDLFIASLFKTNKQTDEQNDKMTERSVNSDILATNQSSVRSLPIKFNTSEGYNSDSTYDSTQEVEDSKKEELYEMKKEADHSVNAVIDSESVPKSSYPLKYKWQFWFWKADQGIKVVWKEALQKVCKPFNTVEDFWRLYHHIIPVRQLVPPSDYCVFKEGITPMWEDSKNIKGGKWTLDFPKGPNRSVNSKLDEIWLEVLLCLIGEGFNEFGDDVCGAVVNVRAKEDRISVWTASSDKSVSNLKIGKILKVRSNYGGKIRYEAHTTTQRVAEAKERVSRLFGVNRHKPKPNRRSCVF